MKEANVTIYYISPIEFSLYIFVPLGFSPQIF